MSEQTDGLAALRVAFKPEQINQIPKGGVVLDYVGHAHITERLLEVDPLWNWTPVSLEDDGRPRFDRNEQGNPVGLWINLTICGLTRAGYGSVIPGKGDAIKELIGDAIRNAAMRFGCGLELWMKERVSDNGSSGGASTGAPPAPSGTAASLPSSVICDACGFVYEDTTALYRMPAKKPGKGVKVGDTIFKCTECNRFSRVAEPSPVPAKDPSDDLPF